MENGPKNWAELERAKMRKFRTRRIDSRRFQLYSD